MKIEKIENGRILWVAKFFEGQNFGGAEIFVCF